MTVFSFEGPSRSGKTTVMDQVVERLKTAGEFPVARVEADSLPSRGIGEDWVKSVQEEHEHRKPIYDENPHIAFLCNRQFSEAAYAYDEHIRHDIVRLAQSYKDGHIVMVTASEEELKERGSKDEWRLLDVIYRYELLTEALPTKFVDTTEMTEDQAVEEVIAYIREVMK